MLLWLCWETQLTFWQWQILMWRTWTSCGTSIGFKYRPISEKTVQKDEEGKKCSSRHALKPQAWCTWETSILNLDKLWCRFRSHISIKAPSYLCLNSFPYMHHIWSVLCCFAISSLQNSPTNLQRTAGSCLCRNTQTVLMAVAVNSVTTLTS